jgi:hypothetical protein
MYKILKADKDTYITNRVISGVRRTKANLGAAGTLDLFKMYGATVSASNPNLELSRLLIHFDLDPIRDLINAGKIDIDNNTFQCRLVLKDVYGGQPTPTNFNIVVHPLSRSFDEGIGRDVVYFSDEDVCNFLTGSRSQGPWLEEGCKLSSSVGSSCDYFSDLFATQTFITGEENLDVDVTTLVSATLAGTIPDAGFRISLSSSHEDDTRTYFVKRFSSRTAYDQTNRPELIVKFDDSLQDDTQLLTFDETFTMFLFNSSKGSAANLMSASATISGSNSLILKLSTEVSGGWYDTVFTGSQHQIGSNGVAGVYSASVYLSSSNIQLQTKLNQSGSVDFIPIWGSLDGTLPFFTGSKITVQRYQASNTSFENTNYIVTAYGVKQDVSPNETLHIRVHLFDQKSPQVKLVKKPVEMPGIVLRDAYYSIRNVDNGQIVIPFDTIKNSTRLSSDAKGMWFNFSAEDLPVDQRYVIDIKTVSNGIETLYQNASSIFRVAQMR